MNWQPVSQPPQTSRTVELQFANGKPNCWGYYWKGSGQWYATKSLTTLRRLPLQPTAWREISWSKPPQNKRKRASP